MRTELTATLAGGPVRGAVTIGALIEIAEHRDDFREVVQRCATANATTIRAVLRACLAAAGDLKPLQVAAEADRLIEQAGLSACGEFAVRLLQDAFDKAETAAGKSPAAASPTATEAAG